MTRTETGAMDRIERVTRTWRAGLITASEALGEIRATMQGVTPDTLPARQIRADQVMPGMHVWIDGKLRHVQRAYLTLANGWAIEHGGGTSFVWGDTLLTPYEEKPEPAPAVIPASEVAQILTELDSLYESQRYHTQNHIERLRRLVARAQAETE